MAKWQIYLFTFCFRQLRKIASDIKSCASTWNKEMKYEDYRCNLLGAEFLFFFLSMKFSNGGVTSVGIILYIVLTRGPSHDLTKHHINFFRQWFSYFWHATLLKMKNVHALNPFVFVLNSSMAMLSVTGWFDLRQKMTAYQKKYK